MEVLLVIAVIIFASTFLIRGLTDFIKELHRSEHKNLLSGGKKLKFNLTISAEDKKEEACAATQTSKDNSG